MKNVHILPTDKPSRLIFNSLHKSFCYQKEIDGMYINDGKVSGADFWSLQKALNNGFKPQNSYITSDEEIKEGDSVITNNGLLAKVIAEFTWHFLNSKKIILTTDQDLIKDGVQAIDDEFLEWFVKNQSCEWVEVIKQELNTDYRSDWKQKFYYKIIIPKEEPKQELPQLGTKEFNNLASAYFGGKPKQETTLEEALKNELEFVHNSCRNFDFDLGFKTGGLIGAKWQAKRSYSEGDMKKAYCNGANLDYNIMISTKEGNEILDKCFEQFKKK